METDSANAPQEENSQETQRPDTPDVEENTQRSLSVAHVILSVFAAAFGVQNRSNLEKDFNAKNSIYIYIVAGVIFTLWRRSMIE